MNDDIIFIIFVLYLSVGKEEQELKDYKSEGTGNGLFLPFSA